MDCLLGTSKPNNDIAEIHDRPETQKNEMPAKVEQLVCLKSQLVGEVLDYLDILAKDCAKLPSHFPESLRERVHEGNPSSCSRGGVTFCVHEL